MWTLLLKEINICVLLICFSLHPGLLDITNTALCTRDISCHVASGKWYVGGWGEVYERVKSWWIMMKTRTNQKYQTWASFFLLNLLTSEEESCYCSKCNLTGRWFLWLISYPSCWIGFSWGDVSCSFALSTLNVVKALTKLLLLFLS